MARPFKVKVVTYKFGCPRCQIKLEGWGNIYLDSEGKEVEREDFMPASCPNCGAIMDEEAEK